MELKILNACDFHFSLFKIQSSHLEKNIETLKVIGETGKSLRCLTLSGRSIWEWAEGFDHMLKGLGKTLKVVTLTDWYDEDDYCSYNTNLFFKSLSENCKELKCLDICPIKFSLPEKIDPFGFQRLTKLEIKYRYVN